MGEQIIINRSIIRFSVLPMGQRAERKSPLGGFSLIEILMAMAIVATLLTLAIPAYQKYTEATKVGLAKQEIVEISAAIDRFYASQGQFPDSLADVNLNNKTDPWGNPYVYTNLTNGVDPNSKARKDGKLHPVNSDYDLYSLGKDGESKPAFNNSKSRDDIVRANNGKFIGLAADY